MTILCRVLVPLKYNGCIEAFNQCNTEQIFTTSFKYEPYNSSPVPHLSYSHSAKKRRNTKRFEMHRLKTKLQNQSNVNILKLFHFLLALSLVSLGADTI